MLKHTYACVGGQMELRLAGCVVNVPKRTVDRDGSIVRLTTRESDLLNFLAQSPDTPFSDYHLLEEVWGYRSAVISRAVDQLLYRLRKKIEIDPSRPDHLVKVYGEGVKFVPLDGESVAVAPSQNQLSLPTWYGAFHGRQASLEYLNTYAKGGQPIAVTGLSGIGKTRLVVRWLGEVNGVRLFVSPEDLREPEGLAMAMAAQVNAPPTTSLDTLLERLGAATVVLDGVPADGEEIREAVASICLCANLTVVYTALRPLDIPGERVWVVPGLSPEASTAMLTELAATAAPQGTGSTDGSEFSGLVELLGGHPLALELCAPRCRTFGVREAERHWRSGSDTSAGQHMAHAVVRSWSLLDASAQTALRRICVFPSGTDVPGVEALVADVGGIAVLEELVFTGFVQVSPRAAISDGMWVDVSRSVLTVVQAMTEASDENQAVSRMADRLSSLTCRLGETTTPDLHMAAAHQPAILRVLEGGLADAQRVNLAFLSAVASMSEPKSRRHLSYRRLGDVRPLLKEADQATFSSLRLATTSSLDLETCLEEAQALLESRALSPAEQVSLALVAEYALTRLGRPQEGLVLLRETVAQSDGEQVPDYPRVRLWTQYAWRSTHHGEPEELFRAASAAVELAARIDDPARVCRAWYMMGIANAENGREQAATYAYEHAVAVGIPGQQQTRTARANLGYHLCRMGRLSEGLPMLQQLADAEDIGWDLKVKATAQLSLIPFVPPDEARTRLSEVDHLMRREAMRSIEAVVAAEWAIVEALVSPAQAQKHLERALGLAKEERIPPSSPTGLRIEVARQRVEEAQRGHKE